MVGDGNVHMEINVRTDISYQKATLLPLKKIERRIEKRLRQLL
jgi:hypothetical protein